MNFEQNIKLVDTCFVYGSILYILILQSTLHVLTQVLIRSLNVCSFTGQIIDFIQKEGIANVYETILCGYKNKPA
jgi:HKD family nuclease